MDSGYRTDLLLLEQELLRAIRGKRSQRFVMRRLKLKSNRVHKWECGHNHIRWNEFVLFCASCHTDLSNILASAFSYPGPAADHALLLGQVIGTARPEDLSKDIEIPASTIGRWLSSKSTPRLIDVLAVMQSCSLSFADFLTALVDLTEVPSFIAEHQTIIRIKKLFGTEPVAAPIIHSLGLDGYKRLDQHSHEFIAGATGISPTQAERLVNQLLELELIEADGSHYKPTLMASRTSEDTRCSRWGHQPTFWLDRARRLSEAMAEQAKGDDCPDPTPMNCILAYKLFALSDDGLDQVHEAIQDMHVKLVDIIQRDRKKPATKVWLAGLHFFQPRAEPGALDP